MKKRFESFVGTIFYLNKCLQKIKAYEMRRLGLRSCNLMCLYFLSEHKDGLTPTQLTEYCKEDKAGISRSLGELIDKGFAVCERTLQQQYRVPYRLTPAGVEAANQLKARIGLAFDNGGIGITGENRKNLYKSLELITTNVSNYWDRVQKEEQANATAKTEE